MAWEYTGTVEGWQIKSADQLEQTWATAFDPGSDRILAAAVRSAGEHVYSHAKVST